MRVTFVYPDVEGVQHYGTKKFYHGIGYLSAVLKQAGHQTGLIYLQTPPTRSDFLQELATTNPDVVAFSSTTHQHPYVEECARWIKESAPELKVVSGGTHPTLAIMPVTQNPDLDVVCQGEAELSFLELVNRWEKGHDISDVPNMHIRVGDKVIHNPMAKMVEDLDIFPFADRELFDYEEILRRNHGWVDMMAGRGCPYQCAYCAVPALQDTYKGVGKYVRYRSVQNVLDEIDSLVNHYNVRTLNFQDDVFTLKHAWTREFTQEYGRRFKHIPYWINTRVERVNYEDIVVELARSGCRGIRVGLESGDENLRRDVLKRKMTNEFIKETFDLFKKHGMETYTCNMLGLPGETAEMIEETIEFNRQLEPTQFQFSVFFPYPMTELHDISIERGLYDGTTVTSYFGKHTTLRQPQLSQEQVDHYYDKFVELKHELALKRRSATRHKIYTWLRKNVYHDDTTRLRRHLNALGALRRSARRLVRGAGKRKPAVQEEVLFPTGG